MPGGMPYALEKGPYMSVIEDYANQSDLQYMECLRLLRSGSSIADLPPLHSTTIQPPNGPFDQKQLSDHMKTDFFGWLPPGSQDPSASPTGPQPPFDAATNPSTGFFLNWYGEAEETIRQSLIRAAEVALGLEHGEDPGEGKKPPRHWYLEIFWKCPGPWLEGWVTWHKHGKGRRDGQVTLIIATPGHGGPLVNTPLRSGDRAGWPEYLENPTSPDGDQGMWVVSQEYHKPFVKPTIEASGMGEWVLPTITLGYKSEGEIVVVRPSEPEGGVLADGRKFVL